MSVLEQPLVFVDIETNGLNAVRGRVIEVAAIRVEGGVITSSFRSLIDPQTELPYYITNLTGITTNDLKGAPTFSAIADELETVLNGAVFVAHNVRFDYSFLKQEFGRVGKSFLPKQLCTVKLSRALHPHYKGHKLADLIARHGFTYSARHRAYDDAAVLWQFLQYAQKQFPIEQLEAAVSQQLRSPALPQGVRPELVRSLPETAGVYVFEDASGQPLYVGKSINIKQRVLSHFGRDHAESKEFKISQSIEHIRTYQTAGELSALLLESQLVKELQPVYNRQLRRTQKLTLARQELTSDGYSALTLEEAVVIDPETAYQIVAVYPRRGRANQSLEEMTKLYQLCPKLMGIERATGACFAYQLKKCMGACIGAESAKSYNTRLDGVFERQRIKAWPYRGAVLLQEQSASEFEGVVVDQWCILAEVRQDEFCEPVVKLIAKHFDLDTYKILQRFMTTKINQLKIQRIDLEALLASSA